MDDAAIGIDTRPDSLASRTLVLTLAASHNTSIAAYQTFFQMCEHPEYIKELREEICSIVKED